MTAFLVLAHHVAQRQTFAAVRRPCQNHTTATGKPEHRSSVGSEPSEQLAPVERRGRGSRQSAASTAVARSSVAPSSECHGVPSLSWLPTSGPAKGEQGDRDVVVTVRTKFDGTDPDEFEMTDIELTEPASGFGISTSKNAGYPWK